MGLGTFLADAFTLPLPSWFYFVLSVASRASAVWSIVAVTIGSLTAACLGYFMSAWFAELPWFRLRMMRVREKIAPLLEAHGLKAMVIMSLLPLPFSITCYVCGSYRIGARLFGAYVALRVPRLIVFYALAYFGFRG
jgi:membrane protein YqaA with SNARE-associated domain